MPWNRHLVLNLIWPMAGAGVVFAILGGWLTGGILAPLCVLFSAGLGAVATAVLAHRANQEALARLRQPEFSVGRSGGMFRDIVWAAAESLRHHQAEAKRAGDAKAELEIASKLQKRSARRMQTALDAIDRAILVCDLHDDVLFANGVARQLQLLSGGSDSDNGTFSRGQKFRIPVLGQLIRETRQRHTASLRRTAELEILIGEESIPYRIVVTALCDEQGSLLGTTTVLEDIRDEHGAKTRHAEFVSSVAHEFKTPMASIKAFLELLLDGDVEEQADQRQLFERIDTQVERLNRLVNSLLSLARIESGALKVQREDGDLNDVLQKAAEVIRPLAAERGQTFTAELSQLYLPVHVDRDLLGQAVINLLSNAVKYTPQRGQITLRSNMDDLEAVIEVEDSGLGIPEESLPKIFDRFYRVPEHVHAAAGTGLGLAFVQSIVEDLHNGRIEVASTVGVGSKFTARMPLGHHGPKRAKKPEAVLATVSS